MKVEKMPSSINSFSRCERGLAGWQAGTIRIEEKKGIEDLVVTLRIDLPKFLVYLLVS